MNVKRLVVAGTVGAGKTTFVQTIGELGFISTERVATDATALLKATTTVAFDFSRIVLSDDRVVHIYGTPGQTRFDFMWDLLFENAHGCLLLVAAHRPGDLFAARQILTFFHQYAPLPLLIGLTHTDCIGALSSSAILTALGYTEFRFQPPVLMINPLDRSSVYRAVATITATLFPQNQPDALNANPQTAL